jgi:hypothetical protein
MFNAAFNNISDIPLAGGGRTPKIGKNMIFWRKIVIFHTKYPKHFRVSLRSAQFL